MGRTIRQTAKPQERAGLIARAESLARLVAEEHAEEIRYVRNAVSANGCRGWALNVETKGN